MVSAADIALSAQATRDELTGIGNTLALLLALDAALPGVDAGQRPLALLQIDLDRFADFNARRGRAAGDAFLSGYANFLRGLTGGLADEEAGRPAGLAFRIGGDEFALLLPAVGRLDARRLAAALVAGGARAGIGLSIGIGVAEPGTADRGALLLAADGALRAVKARGGGQARLLTRSPEDATGAARLVDWLANHLLDLGQALDEAQQQALTDPLTGLPNQRALDQFLLTELPRADRQKYPLAILLIDGDNLREFNTQFGFSAGDDWIRTLGATIAGTTRASDLAVRWRVGDEFVVALPETGRAAAVRAAERIREAVARAATTLPLPVTVSIGIAIYPEDGATRDAILAQAGAANRRAKELGRDRISFADRDPDAGE